MNLTWLCTGSALVLKGRTNLPYTPPAGGGGWSMAPWGTSGWGV